MSGLVWFLVYPAAILVCLVGGIIVRTVPSTETAISTVMSGAVYIAFVIGAMMLVTHL